MSLWKRKPANRSAECVVENQPETGQESQIQTSRSEVLEAGYEESLKLPDSAAHGGIPGRHLLIFLDGTWNEDRVAIGEITPTSVLRMFQEINRQCLPNGGETVIARYYRGVGSSQDNGAMDRFWFGFNGKDEERIRAAAFADLYRNYKSANDSIYIVGFSRGAASARLLARDICIKGLPPELTIWTRHFANRVTGQIEARVEKVEHIGKPTVYPKIRFLGCWDTVDAFVLPLRFPNQRWKDRVIRILKYPVLPSLFGKQRFQGNENTIPQQVHMAVHCVAIDETRNAFLPTLMPAADNVEEVWFPGVHTDVGGGYGDNSLADEAYEFMKNRLLFASKSTDAQGVIAFDYLKLDCVRPDSYRFHFHGLNSNFQTSRDVLGLGFNLRTIRVLGGQNSNLKPKIHSSLFKVMGSPNVWAANQKNNRTWTVNYNPYNFRKLREQFESVKTERT
jgi:uncharacterized protein (DUF2235 family)